MVEESKELWHRFFQIRKEIERVKKENKRMETEWHARQGSSQSSIHTNEYKELILKKTKDAVLLLNRQKEEDMERIRQEFEARRQEQEAKLKNSRDSLEMYRSMLRVMVGELERVVQQLEAEEPVMPMSQGEIEALPSFPSLPQAAAALEQLVADIEGEEEEAAEAEREREERSELDRVAALNISHPEAASSMESTAELGSYWEGIDEYLMEFPDESALPAKEEAAAGPVDEAETSLEAEQERGSNVVPLTVPLRKREDPAFDAGPSTDEIESLKLQYIVGNAAGEDLYDRAGKIIVRKHAAITVETVRRAEAEGKLSTLILQMTLPESEAEAHD